MAEITLKQLAADLQISVDRLLSHTKELGYAYQSDSLLSAAEKKRIEEFLKAPDKVSVTRRSQSALTVNSTQGKSRTINVEVRKTRTYVRKNAASVAEDAGDKKPTTARQSAPPADSVSDETKTAAVEKKASRSTAAPTTPAAAENTKTASAKTASKSVSTASEPPEKTEKVEQAQKTEKVNKNNDPQPEVVAVKTAAKSANAHSDNLDQATPEKAENPGNTSSGAASESASATRSSTTRSTATRSDTSRSGERQARTGQRSADRADARGGNSNKSSTQSSDRGSARSSGGSRSSGAGERSSGERSSGERSSTYQNVTPSARLESGNQGEVRRRVATPAPSRERPAAESNDRPRRADGNRADGNRVEGSRADGSRADGNRSRDSQRPPRSAGDSRSSVRSSRDASARETSPRETSPSREARPDLRSGRQGERQAADTRPLGERPARPSAERSTERSGSGRSPQRTHDLRGDARGARPANPASGSPERHADPLAADVDDVAAPNTTSAKNTTSGKARPDAGGGNFALKDKERRPAVRQKERSKSQQEEERNKAAKKAGKGEKRREVDPLLAKSVPLSDLEALEEVSEKGSRRKKGKEQVKTKHAFAMPTAPQVREVEIYEGISVADLAQQMAVKAPEVIKTLFKMGVMATINHALDCDTATLVIEEMGHSAKLLNTQDVEEKLFAELEDIEEQYVGRPPVVTIMGHVDHGKTSLLDYIRRAKVAAGEAGGITQHVGAYHVTTPRGVITFLDTPGHAAFTAMRSRGATVTDIVVLVVAADDSVMPQTIEAIQHAKAAQVPIIVAVNKIDKPEANPDRVKQDLVAHEVVAEDFGGEVMFVPVSAKAGTGIDELLEAILLQAEVLELKAIANVAARGHILEASLDKGRGPVATVLVQHGYLKKGDVVLTGTQYGRVRAMFDENGKAIEQAGPALPVVILGLSGAPSAGDGIQVVSDERQAREVAEFRQRRAREEKIAQSAPASGFDSVFEKMSSGEQALLYVVIKADVQGSAEALRDSFIKVGNDQAQVKVMAASVGGINESDIHLASTSGAVVIGFNVRADAGSRRLAEEKGINIRYYSIIYDAIDDIKQVLSGMLAPETKEQIIGTAKVLSVFRSSKFGTVAGCLVIEGMVKSGNPIRVLRDNVVVHQGDLSSLRRFKDDVTEVRSGTECGIGLKNFNDVHEGDAIEVFERITVQRTL